MWGSGSLLVYSLTVGSTNEHWRNSSSCSRFTLLFKTCFLESPDLLLQKVVSGCLQAAGALPHLANMLAKVCAIHPAESVVVSHDWPTNHASQRDSSSWMDGTNLGQHGRSIRKCVNLWVTATFVGFVWRHHAELQLRSQLQLSM